MRTLSTLCCTLALTACANATSSESQVTPASPASSATPSATSGVLAGHGKLEWFQGSFDALIAEATRTKKIVFIDFWTDWCGWCKRLDKDTFSDNAVATEMKDVLCYSVDAESKDGRPIAQRFNATGFPLLVFLNSDGSVRDRISGYLPPGPFLKEVRRIKTGEGTIDALRKQSAATPKDVATRLELALKLRARNETNAAEAELATAREQIKRGEGFDTKSIDARWNVAQKLEALGDQAGVQEQIAAIRVLDPEAKSLALHTVKLHELLQAGLAGMQATQNFELAPIKAFLAQEQYPLVLFQGWDKVHEIESYFANEAAKREQPTEQQSRSAAARAAGREAWKHCPEEFRAEWGKYFASSFYEDREWLTPEDKTYAVEVARAALKAAPQSTEHMEMLACNLYVADQRDEALTTLRQALAIEPEKAALKQRLAEFEAAK